MPRPVDKRRRSLFKAYKVRSGEDRPCLPKKFTQNMIIYLSGTGVKRFLRLKTNFVRQNHFCAPKAFSLVQSLILAEYLCVAVFLAFDEEVLILDADAGIGRQGVGDEDV